MSVGLLEVYGTIDVRQFWPVGNSDADTTKIVVNTHDNAFRFQPHPDMPFQTTYFWRDTKVRGRSGLKSPLDKHNRLVVRLQGVDAPELHCQPGPLNTKERGGASADAFARFKTLTKFYRQPLGATATNALYEFLASTEVNVLTCRVWTAVDRPGEVFDTYARFVGNIEVNLAGHVTDINYWLMEQGWTFPAFYSSMSNEEITRLAALAKLARGSKRGVWKRVTKTIRPFDFDLVELHKGDIEVLTKDRGAVLFPKLFRRYCSWAVRKKAGITKLGFQRFLEGVKDGCFVTGEFLDKGIHSATPHQFSNFIKSGRTVSFDAADLVFQEAPSKLLGTDAKEVTAF